MGRVDSTTTRRRAAGIPDPEISTFATLLDRRPGVVINTVRVRVLGGAATCGTGRRARIIATLRPATSYDYIIHVSRETSNAFGLQGYVTETIRYSINS